MHRGTSFGFDPRDEKSAGQILDERLARGEIEAGEYEQKKRLLD